jgi:acyl carrier protein
LPKTSSGKIQRSLCRERYLSDGIERLGSATTDGRKSKTLTLAATSRSPGRETPLDVARRIVLEHARRKGIAVEITPDLDLRADLGIDSVEVFELALRIEEQTDVRLSPDDVGRIVTVGDMLEVVRAPATGAEGQGGSSLGELWDEVSRRIPQLRVIAEEQSGRRIRVGGRWIDDFASANYLGLDLHPALKSAIGPAVERWGVHPSWTRIVASPDLYHEVEERLATFVGAPDVLVFPTVTLLHMGVLPLLAGAEGAILVDEQAHNSLQEACRLAGTRGTALATFRHDDLAGLRRLLEAHADKRSRVIVIDGVYSMRGSLPPLAEMVRLAKAFDATIYVDDAHGFGVLGERPTEKRPYGVRGNGVVRHLGLAYAEDRIVYVGGLSKAFSSLAAFVTCADDRMRSQLCRASTFVFSGPCPTASLASALAAIEVSDGPEGDSLRDHLFSLTRRLVAGAKSLGFVVDNEGNFPLLGAVVGGIGRVMQACEILWEHGILITPAAYPAVPLDRGSLRFTVTAANTPDQVDRALRALEEVRRAMPSEPTVGSEEAA